MPKTLLSPTQQWQRSVELVLDWMASVRPAISELAKVYELFFVDDTWQVRERKIQALFDSVQEQYFASSRRTDFNHQFNHLAAQCNETWALGETWFPAIAQWNDRHLCKGDLVLVMFWNGRERHPVWCISSKGHRLAGYYYDTDRLEAKGTILRLLDVPGQLVGAQLVDPNAEMFFLNLRAGTFASG